MAFDPFTAAVLVGTAASTLSTVISGAVEVAETAGAASEFLGELGDAPQMSEESRKTIELLQEAEALGSELGYTADQVGALTGYHDVTQAKTTLRTMTRFVRAGKQIFSLAAKLQERSQMAMIHAAKQADIQTALQVTQIELAKQKVIQEALVKLRAEREQRRMHDNYLKALKSIGGPQHGLPNFPIPSGIVEAGIALAKKLTTFLVALIGALFLIRVVMNQMSLEASDKYGELLEDTIWTLMLFVTIPVLLQWTFAIGQDLADSLRSGMAAPRQNTQTPSWTESQGPVASMLKMALLIIRDVLFFLSRGLVEVLVGFFVAVFPIVVLLSRMLKLRAALTGLFALLMCLALWPLLWAVVTHFSVVAMAEATKELSIRGIISGVAVMIGNLIMPFWLKGVLTGTSPTQAFSQIATKAAAVASGGTSKAAGAAVAAKTMVTNRNNAAAPKQILSRPIIGPNNPNGAKT